MKIPAKNEIFRGQIMGQIIGQIMIGKGKS